MADVVVIGGGILGATAALHLAEAGAGAVVLLEREPALGTQTTAAGAGFVGYWAGELEAELAEYGMRFYTDLRPLGRRSRRAPGRAALPGPVGAGRRDAAPGVRARARVRARGRDDRRGRDRAHGPDPGAGRRARRAPAAGRPPGEHRARDGGARRRAARGGRRCPHRRRRRGRDRAGRAGRGRAHAGGADRGGRGRERGGRRGAGARRGATASTSPRCRCSSRGSRPSRSRGPRPTCR